MPKVKYNISNAHVATKQKNEDGKISYGTPVAVPGSVSVTLDPKGEITPFYADGIEYYKSSSNSGYEGDWETAHIPDRIREMILKEVLDTNKVLLEKTDVEITEFAFGFQIDGDTKNTRFWFYNCTAASRPSVSGKTNEDKKEVQTETLKISAIPENVAGDDEYYVRAKTTDDVNKTVYDGWFKSVYIPEFTTQTEQS